MALATVVLNILTRASRTRGFISGWDVASIPRYGMVTYAFAFWSYVQCLRFILETEENGVLKIEYDDILKGYWRCVDFPRRPV